MITSYIDRLLTLPQHIAPQHALSNIVWRISRSRNKPLKDLLIRAFMLHYDVDLSEAQRPGIDDYDCFNDFFTRALQSHSRPLPSASDAISCPADGAISQLGRIDHDDILQAKGRYYSLRALLGGDDDLEHRFNNGSFATIYLAPHNYHRVHSPITGTVTNVRYIPGHLFSVNNRTARCVENLFARNERLVVTMDSDAGNLAVIFVGAMLVASMELTCCDVPAAIRAAGSERKPFVIESTNGKTVIQRGAELGRFNMGSTVIILAEPERLIWDPALQHGTQVRVGQSIANISRQDLTSYPHGQTK